MRLLLKDRRVEQNEEIQGYVPNKKRLKAAGKKKTTKELNETVK